MLVDNPLGVLLSFFGRHTQFALPMLKEQFPFLKEMHELVGVSIMKEVCSEYMHIKETSLIQMLIQPRDFQLKDLHQVVFQSMLNEELKKEIAREDSSTIWERTFGLLPIDIELTNMKKLQTGI
jgi:hypothetical protein